MPFLRTRTPSPISTSPTHSTPYAPLPTPIANVLLNAWDSHSFGKSSDALADWLNARWKKSGYQVSRETVCFTLRVNGRDGRMGVEDCGEGAFYRG